MEGREFIALVAGAITGSGTKGTLH